MRFTKISNLFRVDPKIYLRLVAYMLILQNHDFAHFVSKITPTIPKCLAKLTILGTRRAVCNEQYISKLLML
jgi:hypothetical protein